VLTPPPSFGACPLRRWLAADLRGKARCPVRRLSPEQVLGLPAGLAYRECGEDLGHPIEDGP
jgi:hypothetical protein